MKKFLVVAMMAIFAVSAYAAKLSVFGYHEFGGRYYENTNLSDGDSKSGAAYTQELNLWFKIQIDECTEILMSTYPTDGDSRVLGGPDGLYDTDEQLFDLAWIKYRATDMITLEMGRLEGNDYYITDWGTLHSDPLENYVAESMDAIKVSAELSDSATIFALVAKLHEGFTAGNRVGTFYSQRSSNDKDHYVIGADLAFGDVELMPSVSFTNDSDNDEQRVAAYIGAGFALTDSIDMAVAVAADNYDDGDDTFTAFGAQAELNAAVTDAVTFGAQIAYGSNDDGYAFSFGDDFGWTYLIDDKLMDGTGFGDGLVAQAYADFALADRMTLSGVAAVFMSMSDESGTNFLYEDAMGYEFDLALSYEFTEATTATVGGAFASLSDWTSKGDDPDPLYALYWSVLTEF